MNDTTVTAFEREALKMLLAGDNSQLEILRNQLAEAVVSSRKFTGTGFFTHFQVPLDIPRLAKRKRIIIDDVSAEIPGIKTGTGFILFVDDGILNFLEGFTYEEPWPKKIESFKLTYLQEIPRGTGQLRPSSVRDVEFALRDLPAVI